MHACMLRMHALLLAPRPGLSTQGGWQCAQGRWRTPHPDPSPSVSPINGLSGASPVVMVQLKDGTVLFAERPHGDFRTGQENTLLVDVSLPPPVPLEPAGFCRRRPHGSAAPDPDTTTAAPLLAMPCQDFWGCCG